MDREFRPLFAFDDQIDLLLTQGSVQLDERVELRLDNLVGGLDVWFDVEIDVPAFRAVVRPRAEEANVRHWAKVPLEGLADNGRLGGS